MCYKCNRTINRISIPLAKTYSDNIEPIQLHDIDHDIPTTRRQGDAPKHDHEETHVIRGEVAHDREADHDAHKFRDIYSNDVDGDRDESCVNIVSDV